MIRRSNLHEMQREIALHRARQRAFAHGGFGFGFGSGATKKRVAAGSGDTETNLALTGLWRASYGGSPWNGTSSVGVSGNNSMSEGTNPPTNGTNQNGLTPASFNGTSSLLSGTGTLDTYVNGTTASGWVLVNLAAATGDIIIDNNLVFMVTASGGNVAFKLNVGAASVTRAISTGSYAYVTFRYDGVNIQVGVNEAPGAAGGASTAAFSSAISNLTGTLFLGKQLFNAWLNGSVLEAAISDVALTDQNFTDVKSFINTRYSLAL